MTLEIKKALEAVEKRLEEFSREGVAGSVEILIVQGKPLKVRVVKDECLRVSG